MFSLVDIGYNLWRGSDFPLWAMTCACLFHSRLIPSHNSNTKVNELILIYLSIAVALRNISWKIRLLIDRLILSCLSFCIFYIKLTKFSGFVAATCAHDGLSWIKYIWWPATFIATVDSNACSHYLGFIIVRLHVIPMLHLLFVLITNGSHGISWDCCHCFCSRVV